MLPVRRNTIHGRHKQLACLETQIPAWLPDCCQSRLAVIRIIDGIKTNDRKIAGIAMPAAWSVFSAPIAISSFAANSAVGRSFAGMAINARAASALPEKVKLPASTREGSKVSPAPFSARRNRGGAPDREYCAQDRTDTQSAGGPAQ